MAWSVLTWKILRISQSQFLSGKVRAETRHSSYTNTLCVTVKDDNDRQFTTETKSIYNRLERL